MLKCTSLSQELYIHIFTIKAVSVQGPQKHNKTSLYDSVILKPNYGILVWKTETWMVFRVLQNCFIYLFIFLSKHSMNQTDLDLNLIKVQWEVFNKIYWRLCDLARLRLRFSLMTHLSHYWPYHMPQCATHLWK